MTVKEQVKALWRICFQDSEEFIDLYFRLRYKNEVNAVIQNGDKVVSALQMLPYPMTFCGKTVQTSYISGACTHPVTTSTSAVLTMVAITIGQNSAAITSKYNMSATPGGTKKNPKLATRKSDNPCTQCSLIQPNFKKRVSSSIPIMLEGSLIPVK